MKIRNGFVTNSSSSSFVICYKNKNDAKQLYNKLDYECGWGINVGKRVKELVDREIEQKRNYCGDKLENFIPIIEDELRWDNYWRKGSEEDGLSEQIQEFKEKVKDATVLVAIEIDDHSDGDCEHEMYRHVDGEVVLYGFNHH